MDVSDYLEGGKKALSDQEENELLKGWDRMSERRKNIIRDKLVVHNMHFAGFISQKMKRDRDPVEVLSDASLGLVHASKRFDPSVGVRFITYASWWIRESINKHGKIDRLIKIPEQVARAASKVAKLQDNFFKENGRMPSDEEIRALSELSDPLLDQILNNTYRQVTPNNNQEDEVQSSDFIDQVAHSRNLLIDEQTPETVYDDAVKQRMVKEILESMGEREEYIITRYLGLDNNPPMNLDEIGYHLGLSGEMVRQMRDNTLKKMRAIVRRKYKLDLI